MTYFDQQKHIKTHFAQQGSLDHKHCDSDNVGLILFTKIHAYASENSLVSKQGKRKKFAKHMTIIYLYLTLNKQFLSYFMINMCEWLVFDSFW